MELDIVVKIFKSGLLALLTWVGIYARKNAIPILKQLKEIYKIDDRVDIIENNLAVTINEQAALIHAATDPIFIIDAKGNMVYANPAWGSFTGFDNIEDAYGLGWMDAIQDAHLNRIERLHKRLLEHPSSYDDDVPMKNIKTKLPLLARCRTQLIRDKKGNIVKTIGRLQILKP